MQEMEREGRGKEMDVGREERINTDTRERQKSERVRSGAWKDKILETETGWGGKSLLET